MTKKSFLALLLSLLMLPVLLPSAAGSEVKAQTPHESQYVKERDFRRLVSAPEFRALDSFDVRAADMHMPILLLDSPDARAVNLELERAAKDLAALYESCRKGDSSTLLYSQYEVYADDKLLSLLLSYANPASPNAERSLAYVFALPEGRRLSEKEMMQAVGLGENGETVLEEAAWSYYEDYLDYAYTTSQDMLVWLDREWDGYGEKETKKDFPLSSALFLNEEGSLLYDTAFPAQNGRGYMPSRLSLTPDLQLQKDQLNPYYVMLANYLGEKALDMKAEVLVLYLGSREEHNFAELTGLEAVLRNEMHWDEAPHLLIQRSPQDLQQMAGDHAWLIVPRYDNAYVRMEGDEMPDPYSDFMYEATHTGGRRLIFAYLNEQGDFPKPSLLMRYRGRELRFTLNSESLDALPEGVRDLSFIMEDIDKSDMLGYYDYLITEKLTDMIQ